MSLSPGTSIGHYDVTSLLGEGGMGQVWEATDTQLNRQVALKILPDAFADDPDRLARFTREAQILASLNHPNIAAIYGIEEAEGTRALVLELVAGPTMADRIAQGAIPLDEALPIAKQIAEALEAAHEQGVIHRDLKPANIKVRADGTVKVLDFGLAKAFQPDPANAGAGASMSPTISLTAAATKMGMVIGTAAYMAPEQASGKAVDKRADVWAFGVVLYEMLTGTRTFVGDDVSKTLARVIDRDPDWTALPDNVPPVLSNFLRHCLQKNPKKRIRDIGDVSLAMEGAFEATLGAPAEALAAPQLRLWQRPTAAVLAAVLIAGGLAVWSATRPAPPTSQTTRFPIALPQGNDFGADDRHFVALSPDGVHLAYVGYGQIYLRPMDQMEATPIRGTEGGGATFGRSPFFSADGQWLGFWAENQLKRVSLTGGAPVTLADAENPWGASWSADDAILFGQADGIWRVPGTGGTPELVIAVGEGEQAQSPQLLPGGAWVLFTLRPSGASNWNQAQIVAESLETAERRVLIDGGRDARYVSTGHLVYALNGTLLAVGFDPDTLRVTRGPVPLVEGVADAGDATGAAHFALSDTGTLVYVPGEGRPGFGGGGARTLVWVDREGREAPIATPVVAYNSVRLSPDGTRAVVEVAGANTDVWLSELARGTLSRLTTDPAADENPLWTPNGQRVVFTTTRDGSQGIFWRPADGPGAAEQLLTIDGASSYSPAQWVDDRTLLVWVFLRATGADIGVLSLDGEPSWQPLLATDAQEFTPTVSPDGRWIAYSSNETGAREVYVQRFPELGDKRQISVGGGQDPVWSPDGRELFYLRIRSGAPPDAVMVVALETEPTVAPGRPEVLFEGVYYRPLRGGRRYDLSPGGARFLMITVGGQTTEDASAQIHVVLNWTQELLERVPID